MYHISVKLSGVRIGCALRFAETGDYFRRFAVETPGTDEPCAALSSQTWEELEREGIAPSAFAEYSVLTPACSDCLLPFDRVVIHAAALRWRDRAWLICADSGVGKSTQARCLQQLRPGEFGIISGDRPILQFCHSERSEESVSPVQSLPPGGKVSPQTTDEGTILVHPSPWNGKENWYGAEAAPLAGLILLERGDENRLTSLPEREAVLPMYTHFIHTCTDPENIRRVAALETRLLRAVPLWKLTTCQVPDSTKLLIDAVFSP